MQANRHQTPCCSFQIPLGGVSQIKVVFRYLDMWIWWRFRWEDSPAGKWIIKPNIEI
jgi:hypothetical protein